MNILIANPALRFKLENDDERYFFGAGCRFPWSLRKNKSEYPRFAMFPFFLGYSAAVAERDGFNVKAIDAVPLNLPEDEFIRRAIEARPDLIIFEPATPAINWVGRISRELSDATDAYIVFAGSHATNFAKEILAEHKHVDFVLVGEYEMAFGELLRRLRAGQSLEGLKGVAYRAENGEFRGGERAIEIDPVDQLPPPARHLFPSYFNQDLGRYHDGFCQHKPTIQLHSSRGCPFKCNFCLWIQIMYANGKQRCFSPSRTVDEMIQARDKHGAKEVYFDDDDFTVNKKHVMELCDEMDRRKVGIPWSVMGDAMANDPETLERMAKSGCIGMKFGLESADPTVLKRMNKPIKLDRVHQVVNAAQRLGIKTHMTVTFGLLGETQESMKNTFEFCKNLDVDSVQFSVGTPYPGTRFYRDLEQAGRLKNPRWEDFDGANNAVFEAEKGLDPSWIEEFEATVHGRWLRHKFKDPKWVLRQIRYFARLTKGQGLPGLKLRLSRGYRLLIQRGPSKHALPPLPAPELAGVPAPELASVGAGLRQRVTGPRP